MKLKSLVLSCALVAGVLQLDAQTRRKTANEKSPSAETSVSLAGAKIGIEYNAPSARDRAVEGGLIPYGKVWRAGADSATTLTTDADIMIGDLKVPKGVYTLYVMAAEGDWKLIVNKQTGQWGTVYKADQDLGRTALKLKTLSAPVEKLDIALKGSGKAGTLTLTWGKTAASVPVKVQ